MFRYRSTCTCTKTETGIYLGKAMTLNVTRQQSLLLLCSTKSIASAYGRRLKKTTCEHQLAPMKMAWNQKRDAFLVLCNCFYNKVINVSVFDITTMQIIYKCVIHFGKSPGISKGSMDTPHRCQLCEKRFHIMASPCKGSFVVGSLTTSTAYQ